MELPPLPEHVMATFSSVMQHLDRLNTRQHLNFFAQLSDFARLVQEPLRKGTELPNGRVSVRSLRAVQRDLVDARILLYDGLSIEAPEKIIPYYEEAVTYLADYPEARRLFSALRQFQSLYAIYRLWAPGLMTSRELADFAGTEPNDVSNTIKRLRDNLRIIEQRTRGLYARGENGRMAMNLFAIVIALWRRVDDTYSDLYVDQIARLVRYRLEPGEHFSVLDGLETKPVPIIDVPSCEPILVNETDAGVRYSTSRLLYQAFLAALDKLLDSDSPASMKAHHELPVREGRVIRNKTRVGDVFRRAVSEEGMLFIRLDGQLRFVPLLCSQTAFQ